MVRLERAVRRQFYTCGRTAAQEIWQGSQFVGSRGSNECYALTKYGRMQDDRREQATSRCDYKSTPL
jgi:hypothetical protein